MKNILITGAGGYLGRLLTEKLTLQKHNLGFKNLLVTDVNYPENQFGDEIFKILDVRNLENILFVFKKYSIDCVIHLAWIVTPRKNTNRGTEYAVDVEGTRNILKACVKCGVRKIIISSSGAAYGYHPRNVKPLDEHDELRGNYEFAYSYHKKLVEEELELYRIKHPELSQVIFRMPAILGRNANNQITDLFKKPVQIGLIGTDVPFCFIWEEDAVDCFLQAIISNKKGVFNLSGDGVVSLQKRAVILSKPYVKLPFSLIRFALVILKKIKLTQYDPEQLLYLKYRPVLNNKRLKKEFGFIPKKSSFEVFEEYVEHLKSASGSWSKGNQVSNHERPMERWRYKN